METQSIPQIYIDSPRASYDTRETSYVSHISRMSSDFESEDFGHGSCSFQETTIVSEKKISKFKSFLYRLFKCRC